MNKKVIIFSSITVVVIVFLLILFLLGRVEVERSSDNSNIKKEICTENICFSELADFDKMPSANNSFVITDNVRYTIKSGESVEIKVGFFNNQSESVRAGVTLDSCLSVLGVPWTLNSSVRDDEMSQFNFMNEVTGNKCGFNPQPIVSSIPQQISPGESTGFLIVLHAKCIGEPQNKIKAYSSEELDTLKDLPSTIYGCKLKIVQVDEKGNILDNGALNFSTELFELAVEIK